MAILNSVFVIVLPPPIIPPTHPLISLTLPLCWPEISAHLKIPEIQKVSHVNGKSLFEHTYVAISTAAQQLPVIIIEPLHTS